MFRNFSRTTLRGTSLYLRSEIWSIAPATERSLPPLFLPLTTPKRACTTVPALTKPPPRDLTAPHNALTPRGTDALIRIERLPLILVEEFLPRKLFTELELLLTAWTEERAQYLRYLRRLTHFITLLVFIFFVALVYYSTVAADRKIRGTANVPAQMRVGAVTYFDISEDGHPPSRVVFGLLTEQCPLYTEYFHRLCCGIAAPDGGSFRGQKLMALMNHNVAVFGQGAEMTHGVPDFNPRHLPREDGQSTGPWRGALTALAYSPNKQSPNFCIHTAAGQAVPQVFGIVLAGFDVVERMHRNRSGFGAAPRRDYEIVGCGELCTLDKSRVTPLPWALYSGISNGYDAATFEKERDGVASELDWQALLQEDAERIMKER